MTDLVFYDTEATDADTRHGQITQFGAVRADTSLNPLESLELKVRRLPWVVPTPEALRVTQMAATDLDSPDRISEYEASRSIEKFLVPGYGMRRILVTWNGIKFDDELIRTTLFRNLRSPWFSSGKTTGRMDLLDVARLAHSCSPTAFNVPLSEEGKPVWKLDRICPANGIEIKAHDAVGDALATLSMANMIKDRVPAVWEMALRCSFPAGNESLLQKAHKDGSPIYLYRHFGEADVVPCAVLGTNGKKSWVLTDLRRDDRPILSDEIAQSMYTKGTPFPVIRSNASPLIIDAATAAEIDTKLDPASIAAEAMGIKLDGQLCEAATKALKSASFDSLVDATNEERIYAGFIKDADKPSMTAFHRAADWKAREAIEFQDPRLRDFAARIILEAVMKGEHEVEETVRQRLEHECAQALSRPYARGEQRWATIESALSGEVDDNWLNWAKEAFPLAARYDSSPVSVIADTEQVEDEEAESQQKVQLELF